MGAPSCSTICALPERWRTSSLPRRFSRMNPKHGLGRGLGALLASSPYPSTQDAFGKVQDLPIESITANPNQPRKSFEDNSLRELADSLRRSGVLQPVVVRKIGDKYQLIVGERRWRAARMAGLSHVPAVVRETTDAETLELALVENLLREDLNPMEEAEAYQRLLTDFAWTQEQLGQRVGRDRSTVANCLRLLRLRDEILAHSWSVRATEEGVQQKRRLGTRRVARRSPELTVVEDSLREALSTRVRLVGTERAGRIEIVYTSAEDLERLAELIGGRRP